MDTPQSPIKLLLEMRPALQGHAGIPQETRLLFRGLSLLENLHVEGLLQNNERMLAPGLPPKGSANGRGISKDEQLNRLGRVVIALEEKHWDTIARATIHTIGMALWHFLGGRQTLTRFEPAHFEDFLWHRFFSRTLAPQDFPIVTRAGYRIARVPWNAMHICALVTRTFGFSLFPRLDTSEFDIMISETPFPATVSANTRLIVRYHDAIPMLMPHTISERRYHHAWHYYALRRNVEKGAWFACVSEATRKDLVSIFPQAAERSVTIHNMVSHHYFDEPSDSRMVPEIIRTRLNGSIEPPLELGRIRQLLDALPPSEPMQYLLIVATVEPRKNHSTLLASWERLRVERFPKLKLVLVGAPGWHNQGIIKKFRPWMERGDVFLLTDVASGELRLLYKHALATVCPSFGEGFDFAGVESMKSGGAVIASDIPVHREVYDVAAEYFNPYSGEDLDRAIVAVVDPSQSQRRQDLVANGAQVARRYTHEAILPKWQGFLGTLMRVGSPGLQNAAVTAYRGPQKQ